MALVLEANYSKKLGLPGYSSHQYSITVRTELADVNQVEAESKRFVRPAPIVRGSRDSKHGLPSWPTAKRKSPSPFQRQRKRRRGGMEMFPKNHLILQLVDEKKLSNAEVEQLAVQLFGIARARLEQAPCFRSHRGTHLRSLPARGASACCSAI